MGMQAYFAPADSPTEVDMKYIQLLGACTRAPEEIVARLILMGISVSVNSYYMWQEQALGKGLLKGY